MQSSTPVATFNGLAMITVALKTISYWQKKFNDLFLATAPASLIGPRYAVSSPLLLLGNES
jgi:hypothetical protein